MIRRFGFSLSSSRASIAVALVLLALLLGYHRLIQNSVRNQSATVLQAVHDHCRFVAGKQIGRIPAADLEGTLQLCEGIQLQRVEATGGVLDPVFVKVTMAAPIPTPLSGPVLIFRQAEINPRKFHLLSSLSSLTSGRWNFNFYNTYSEAMYSGSF